jgi:hypothetical protein
MNEILEGWKTIAQYARKSESTLKRYKKKGLEIRKNKAGHPVTTKEKVDKFLLGEQAA